MKIITLQITLFIFLVGTFICHGQEIKKLQIRQPAVAGSFYPGDAQSLKTQLHQFYNNVEDKTVDENISAIIVPHAGYIFSGQVAASAYAKIDSKKSFSRIFLIGTSHRIFLNGASIYNQGDYKTPLGTVNVDTELANQLINENRIIKYVPDAHKKEHSLEVQLPFLQYHLQKPFKIIPIIIGSQSSENCKKLAEILKPYFTPENLFVISSDFSHYPSYKNANKYDQETGLAVTNNSPSNFIKTIKSIERKNIPGLSTSCCGWTSVLTLLNITSEQKNIQVQNTKYLNSGDSPYGDKVNVVGYHSFIFTFSEDDDTSRELFLSPKDKQMLLKIARESIQKMLKNNSIPEINEDDLSETIKLNCGAFVTLNKNEQLRGCIGRFMPNEPLYKVVQEMAVAAAFNDTRFIPVMNNEIKNIDIEISVLTPLKKINSIDDFQHGVQGIYMIKGNRSGTFLPKVAQTTNWTKEEFLGHCARDKAGIGWYGWKDADLYTYEALVFDEKEQLSKEK